MLLVDSFLFFFVFFFGGSLLFLYIGFIFPTVQASGIIPESNIILKSFTYIGDM